jgi:hypothetical protein
VSTGGGRWRGGNARTGLGWGRWKRRDAGEIGGWSGDGPDGPRRFHRVGDEGWTYRHRGERRAPCGQLLLREARVCGGGDGAGETGGCEGLGLRRGSLRRARDVGAGSTRDRGVAFDEQGCMDGRRALTLRLLLPHLAPM